MRKIIATGLVLGIIAGFLIGNVRAAEARAVEPLSVPCVVVRASIKAAGGLENAIREALKRGYRPSEIRAVIRRCGLR